MIIKHDINSIELKKDISEDLNAQIMPSFLLTNKAGSYTSMNTAYYGEPQSKYNGVFFFPKKLNMMRVIENINPLDSGKIVQVNNYGNMIKRERENLKEAFAMPAHFSALAYKTEKRAVIELILDVRYSYDSRNFGKEYKIYEEDGLIIIEFTKKTDNREDDSHDVSEYKMYVAIATDHKGLFKKRVANDYHIIDKWFERKYPFDSSRQESGSMWVYHALNLSMHKAIFAFSGNKQHAIKEAEHLIKHFDYLFRPREIQTKISLSKIHDEEIRTAYVLAKNSLEHLVVANKKVFAGLPWFFQFWSRDMAISAKALMLEGKNYEAKKILLELIDNISPNGRIPNRIPSTELGSADGVGWTFKRIRELENLNKWLLSSKEKKHIKARLNHSIELLKSHCTKDNLDINLPDETWMDTLQGDGRSGARIEIQALRLQMYNYLADIDNNSEYLKLENELKKTVRRNFWNGNILRDGKDDSTIRPNIFLAYYIYDDLLTKDEWKKTFDTCLARLWCEFGGLSTIDKKDSRFQPEYTGKDNKSYHNGDSWFFVNNIAAIAMLEIDSSRYHEKIESILQAGAREILWQGALGHQAELTSASELRSQGCWSQAWSAATFIELVHKRYG